MSVRDITKEVAEIMQRLSSPEVIAAEFCEWSSDRQAAFFNEVRRLSISWMQPASLQWRYMENHLTPGAANMLVEMAEHTDGARR